MQETAIAATASPPACRGRVACAHHDRTIGFQFPETGISFSIVVVSCREVRKESPRATRYLTPITNFLHDTHGQ